MEGLVTRDPSSHRVEESEGLPWCEPVDIFVGAFALVAEGLRAVSKPLDTVQRVYPRLKLSPSGGIQLSKLIILEIKA
ncbi:MAG: hypothetical protein M1820_009083 [Bogoriella megaspora]|nr:MAG: hypothetical protein M1820_009083 [Bogoriella megaspora]